MVILLPYLDKFMREKYFMPITLAQLIREARQRLESMTQGELGKLAGTSLENVTAIENERNRQPSPDVIAGLSRALELRVVDIYAAITGTLNNYPWDRVGDLDLKDAELELMFRQVDDLLEGESRERVKAFIRFTLDEERRKLRRDMEEKKRSK
jgi:DNA-binding XRE family transcriptional regulator